MRPIAPSCALALALIAIVRLTPAQADEPAAPGSIQGAWRMIYAETDGKPAPADRVRPVKVVIGPKSHQVWFGDQEVAHDIAYEVDDKASPKAVTDTLPDGKHIRGIFEVDGDTLISCVSAVDADRPKAFATAPGSGVTLRVFRRSKPDEPAAEAARREQYIRFGGTWAFGPAYLGDQALPEAAFKEARLVLRGDRCELVQGENRMKGSYSVDPESRPMKIDVTWTDGPAKGAVAKGLYSLEGDTYTTAMSLPGGDRPEALEKKAGGRYIFQTLQRLKD